VFPPQQTPMPKAKQHSPLRRFVGGIAGAVIVVLLLVLKFAGVGLFFWNHHEHGVKDAETTVDTFLSINTSDAQTKAQLSSNWNPKTDFACTDAQGNSLSGGEYSIDKSKKESDSTAEVDVSTKNANGLKLTFQLDQESGAWKITKITCS